MLISSIANCNSEPIAPVNLLKKSRIACKIKSAICSLGLREYNKRNKNSEDENSQCIFEIINPHMNLD